MTLHVSFEGGWRRVFWQSLRPKPKASHLATQRERTRRQRGPYRCQGRTPFQNVLSAFSSFIAVEPENLKISLPDKTAFMDLGAIKWFELVEDP